MVAAKKSIQNKTVPWMSTLAQAGRGVSYSVVANRRQPTLHIYRYRYGVGGARTDLLLAVW